MSEWPAAKVEMRGIGDLIPYVNNARTHSPEQVDQIAASMKEWGWTNPVLVDEDGMIIAGHGRVEAARKLKIKSVPTMTAKGWTEAQKKAYVLADNQLALNAGWNDDTLRIELQGLEELDFDLDLLGFNEFERLSIMLDREEGETDPLEEWDEMPEFEPAALSFRSIVCHFQDQKAWNRFVKFAKQEISDKAKFVWFPPKEREDLVSQEYTSEPEISSIHPD